MEESKTDDKSKSQFLPTNTFVLIPFSPRKQETYDWPAKTIGLEDIPPQIREHPKRNRETQLVYVFGFPTQKYEWIHPPFLHKFDPTSPAFQGGYPVTKLEKAHKEALKDFNLQRKIKVKSRSWKEELRIEKELLCQECQTYGGDRILCNLCDRSFHLECAGMNDIPEGEWECIDCCEVLVEKKKRKKRRKNTEKSPTRKNKLRIERPRLGEIPEVESKKVSCNNKTGTIIGSRILCDCCRKKYSINQYEVHCGLIRAKNPYHTIFVSESGKKLHYYRCCMYCRTPETPEWMDGPFGSRTFCESCHEKWIDGNLKEELFRKRVEANLGLECRKYDKENQVRDDHEKHGKNCTPAPTFDFDQFTYEEFLNLVIHQRTPVVLRNTTKHLNPDTWNLDFLRKNYGKEEIMVRYMSMSSEDNSQYQTVKDASKTMSWFLDNCEKEKIEDDPDFDKDCTREGYQTSLYAKDFSFGEQIPEWLEDILRVTPPYLHPGGKYDIIGYMPKELQPIVWMGYLGTNGSRTPLHIDKLATVAFNLHVCGEGSKEWWLIDSSQTEKLEEILEKQKGYLIRDNFWMAPLELEQTGLNIWYHEQKKGDLVIVPPLVPHTVLNKGGISCAVAANLLNEFYAREAWERDKKNKIVGRDGIYRLRTSIYFCFKTLVEGMEKGETSVFPKLQRLFPVFEELVQDEADVGVKYHLDDGYYICDQCNTEIFNRRYHCTDCRLGDYDICVQCYHLFDIDHCHKLIPYEKIKYEELLNLLERGRDIITFSEVVQDSTS